MKDCTCLGTCKGKEGLGPGWRCALEPVKHSSERKPMPDWTLRYLVAKWIASAIRLEKEAASAPSSVISKRGREARQIRASEMRTCANELDAALRVSEGQQQSGLTDAPRCEGRYPVPQTSPPRSEPFEVTYRCGLHQGHDGPHRAEPMVSAPSNRLEPVAREGGPVAQMIRDMEWRIAGDGNDKRLDLSVGLVRLWLTTIQQLREGGSVPPASPPAFDLQAVQALLFDMQVEAGPCRFRPELQERIDAMAERIKETLLQPQASPPWQPIVEALAEVYTVDTDQVALIRLVQRAKEAVNGQRAVDRR